MVFPIQGGWDPFAALAEDSGSSDSDTFIRPKDLPPKKREHAEVDTGSAFADWSEMAISLDEAKDGQSELDDGLDRMRSPLKRSRLFSDESSSCTSSDSEESLSSTPRKFRKLESSLNSFKLDKEWSLDRREKTLLKEAMLELRMHPSSPERREYARRGVDACMKQLFPVPEAPRSPKKQRLAAKVLQESPWVSGLLDDFSRMTGEATPHPKDMVVNFGHISTPDNGKGFHLSLANESLGITYHNIMHNPITGVWSASYQLSGSEKTKFSTFFPKYIQTEGELLELLASAVKVAQTGNRLLLRIQPKNKMHFYAEAYLRHQRYIYSAFPSSICADCPPGKVFAISDKITISSEEVHRIAKKMPRSAISFSTRREDFIDIASELNTEIKTGIYFRFPKGVL